MTAVAIPMGEVLLVEACFWQTGMHCRSSSSTRCQHPALATTHIVKLDSSFWILLGTTTRVPHNRQPSADSTPSFLKKARTPVRTLTLQANPSVQEFHFGQHWVALCLLTDLPCWNRGRCKQVHQLNCLWRCRYIWGKNKQRETAQCICVWVLFPRFVLNAILIYYSLNSGWGHGRGCLGLTEQVHQRFVVWYDDEWPAINALVKVLHPKDSEGLFV